MDSFWIDIFVYILEVAKNLVLAGIKSLRMVDSENLSLEDGTSQFLAPRDKVRKEDTEFGTVPTSCISTART